MPRRKDGEQNTEVVKVRLNIDTIRKANEVRMEGGHAYEAESTFLGYLLNIGLNRYAVSILPMEKGEETVLSS